jgi:hypothetical protein
MINFEAGIFLIIEENEKLKKENQEMRELINGCYEIISIHKTESPSQEDWKKNWLKKAKEFDAGFDY